MELAALIEGLSRRDAYPEPTAGAEVRQTHISVVFLTDRHVYKIKKPVDLGFLDFSTLDQRLHFCQEEVRLNARLAPEVYLGVVPVVSTPGGPRFEQSGEAVEWGVKMVRLPDDATLAQRLPAGTAGVEQLQSLARRLAEFHRLADHDEKISAYARYDKVAANIRQSIDYCSAGGGQAISGAICDRIRELVDQELQSQRNLIEARTARNVPCDAHGDLRLEHIYWFPDRAAPRDWVIMDCIEFSPRYRYIDPVADMAFLAMDLRFAGRAELASRFADAYFAVAGDDNGRALLPLYVAYRAAVRGKVETVKMGQTEVDERQRSQSRQRAGAYWLLTLAALEVPNRRPAVLLVGGLPGVGKSTLARELAQQANFHVIRSDVVRKELAGAAGQMAASFEGGIYTPPWTERTYEECLRRAERLLFEGKRVLIDASFRDDWQRRVFFELAARWSVPAACLICQADREVVRRRLAERRGDASDADWSVYEQAEAAWQPAAADLQLRVHAIDTASTLNRAVEAAQQQLRAVELVD